MQKMLQLVFLSLVIEGGHSLVIKEAQGVNLDFEEWQPHWYPPLLGSGSPQMHESSAQSPIKTYFSTTFVAFNPQGGKTIPGDDVYVVIFPNEAGPSKRKDVSGNGIVPTFWKNKDFVKLASHQLKVTAIIVISKPANAATDTYSIRWFGDSGVQYNVCGHGNAAAAACIDGNQTLEFQPGCDADESDENCKACRQMQVTRAVVTGGVGSEQMIGSLAPGNYFNAEKKNMTPAESQAWEKIMKDTQCPGDTNKFNFFTAPIGIIIEVPVGDCLRSINRDQVALQSQNIVHKDGIIMWSLNGPTTSTNTNIIYRAFYPKLGVSEDPTTGSAFALVTAAASKSYGNGPFTGQQISKSQATANDGKGGIAMGTLKSKVKDNNIYLDAVCTKLPHDHGDCLNELGKTYRNIKKWESQFGVQTQSLYDTQIAACERPPPSKTQSQQYSNLS